MVKKRRGPGVGGRARTKTPEAAGDFPDLMRDTRKKRGWTQAEAAERLGVRWITVSSWERGLRRPGHGILRRIAREYRISLRKLAEIV